MAEIPLVNSNLRVKIDDEDYEKVNKHRWVVQTSKNGLLYARSSTRPHVHLARYIIESYKGRLPKYILIDHVDRNPLNCTKYNLRLASYSENGANSNIRTDNTSGYKGVHLLKGAYIARIRVDGTRIYLGSFKKAKDAAIAYNNAAIKYFGSFAKLNVI